MVPIFFKKQKKRKQKTHTHTPGTRANLPESAFHVSHARTLQLVDDIQVGQEVTTTAHAIDAQGFKCNQPSTLLLCRATLSFTCIIIVGTRL